MPSIPQSLLWISLVVLWLFVLVPMLISKRDNVRRTSDVALATRVLNDGRASRLLRRRAPAAGHYSDPDWRPSENDLDDDDLEDADTTPKRAVVLAAAMVVTETDYLDVDVVDEDSGALPVGASAAAEAIGEPELQLDFDTLEESEEDDEIADTDTIATCSDEELEDEESESDEYDDEDLPEIDGTDHDYEYVSDTSGLEAPSDAEDALPSSLSQARRQRYESKTAAAVSARKYKFRKRMITAMSVLLLASAVAAYVVSPALWWVSGSLGAVTLLYLGYLRRQTRIEEQVRRRRAQRMMRARLGVENTGDQEFDVVPSRLRRPGAIVLEIDDEDPVFEHLDYAPVAHDYHLPRAAGQ